jgi:hypothetical protein
MFAVERGQSEQIGIVEGSEWERGRGVKRLTTIIPDIGWVVRCPVAAVAVLPPYL